MQCVLWTSPVGGLCNMDQWYKSQYLYKILGKCFFFQTINKQGNYKTDLAEVSGPITQAGVGSQILRSGTVTFNLCVAPSKSRTYLHQ